MNCGYCLAWGMLFKEWKSWHGVINNRWIVVQQILHAVVEGAAVVGKVRARRSRWMSTHPKILREGVFGGSTVALSLPRDRPSRANSFLPRPRFWRSLARVQYCSTSKFFHQNCFHGTRHEVSPNRAERERDRRRRCPWDPAATLASKGPTLYLCQVN